MYCDEDEQWRRSAEHFKRRVAGSINSGGAPQSDCLLALLHWICIFGMTFLGFSLGSADACSLEPSSESPSLPGE